MQLFSYDPPPVASRNGGLLNAIDTITDFDKRAMFTGIEYEKNLDVAPRTIPTDGSEKTFDRVENIQAVKFGAYTGIERSLLINGGDAGVEDSHKRGISHAVESAVQKLLLNPVAVDITPTAGTAVTDMRFALGLLEQYVAERYSGLPLIHANRLAVTLMEDLEIDTSNWKIHSTQGTPIANGSGYDSTGPSATAAGAGEAWVYVSGHLNVWQGDTHTTEGVMHEENLRHILVETEFLANVDGPVAAILVGSK